MGRARVRVVAALLLAFAIWPLCHYFVVDAYRLNPWKFFGWAMYTVHIFHPKVEVYSLDGGNRIKLPLTERSLHEAATERDEFAFRRREWGLLEKPDYLAGLVQDVLQPSEGIEVVIKRFVIDPVFNTVRVSRGSYFYLADGQVVEAIGE